MTWSYDLSTGSVKDQVRFLIGDTQSTKPQLSDEEINFLVNQFGTDPTRVAIAACDRLIARYSRDISISMDGVSRGAGDRVDQYRKLKATLASTPSGLVGPQVAPAAFTREDGEEVEPFFTRETPNSSWPY